MKKKILSMLLALSMVLCMMPSTAFATDDEIAIDSTNFPDRYFREIAALYDDDNSGGLSNAEIAAATEIKCSDEKIKKMSGIEYFTELQYLDCADNEISQIDLRYNKKLQTLYCNRNEITALNLSYNTQLKVLDCSNNELANLDLSKNTLLTTLTCGNNGLTSLDLSNNSLLTKCNVYGTYTVQANADRTFDLSTLPAGFDLEKVIGCTGGSVNGNILTFDEGTKKATYEYLCRQGITARFTLVAENLHTCTFGEWISNGNGTHTRTCTVSGCDRSETEESAGTGTEKDPYMITTAAQLDAVRNDMNACYRLNADIVFTAADFEEDGDFYNEGKGWLPLGAKLTSSGNETAFRGIFDGNGHVIKGLYINRPSENETGLFKYLGGTIKSLGLEDGQIIGSTRVGAFVGMVDTYAPKYERQILNCYNTCAVTAVDGYAGGIAGEGRGTIDSCYNAGEIESGQYGCAGGIVPIMQSGSISNCYNSGDIIGGNAADGIAGQVSDNASASKSYSVGTQYIGTSYNGHAKGFGYVMNSTSSETGKTIEEMKQKETFSSFDFDTVWSISSADLYPYPTLRTVANASKQSSLDVKHKGVALNAKEATCTENGYTGDLTCEGCGEKLSTGSVLNALGHVEPENYEYDKTSHWKVCTRENCGARICEEQHSGGTATVTEPAVCEVCKQPYGKCLAGSATISGTSMTNKQGKEIIVDLNLEANTGLASMLVELEYDKAVLEFISAENGAVFSDESFIGTQDGNNVQVLSWINGTAKQNITATGKLATLKFRIKDEAATGDYEIAFKCSSEKYEAIDAGMNAVNITTNPTKVTVVKFFYGDVDGNDKVDSSDALWLKRYLAKWNGYTINAEAADLDADGTVTLRDITILQRHIADWTGYDTLPVTDDTLPTA